MYHTPLYLELLTSHAGVDGQIKYLLKSMDSVTYDLQLKHSCIELLYEYKCFNCLKI